VRINVSSGPKDVGVPDVRGQAYESAASQLQAQGFAVARQQQDSDQPPGVVIAQDPAGNSFVAPHSTITLTVSNGPTTTGVPDVGGSDAQTAKGILKESGFKVQTQKQDTDNPSLDGIVISQDPPSGTEAEPGATVTIVVGHYKKPEPPPPPPATTTTETIPTTTATTTTITTTPGAPPP